MSDLSPELNSTPFVMQPALNVNLRMAVLVLFTALFCCSNLPAQFVDLDLSGSGYVINSRALGATGITFSMDTLPSNNPASLAPHGFSDGSLVMGGGQCTNCGRTVRITFSSPVEILISGKLSGVFNFDAGDLWNFKTSSGTLTLTDPQSELIPTINSPSDISFTTTNACAGAGPTPCQSWMITSTPITSLDIEYEGLQFNNKGGVRFRAAPPVSTVPTLSQWGLILFGLVVVCMGVIGLWYRSMNRDQRLKGDTR